YPGNKYVDVLAADIYANDYKQSHHDQLLELGEGKPIAIGECGQLPTPEILSDQPHWVWFMCWSNHIWNANEPEQTRRLYQHQKVVTLNELNQ
ncbi:MAG TPA: glycosyl hydrolase, partial [Bacteroidales bacterium]|nr:glycosyl hydrolase [Bacteroidales bacterium]